MVADDAAQEAGPRLLGQTRLAEERAAGTEDERALCMPAAATIPIVMLTATIALPMQCVSNGAILAAHRRIDPGGRRRIVRSDNFSSHGVLRLDAAKPAAEANDETQPEAKHARRHGSTLMKWV